MIRILFAAGGVLLTILMIGWGSGYTANPARRGPAPMWIGVLGLLAFAVMGGLSLGLASLLASSVAERGSVFGLLVVFGLGMTIIWADFVAIQFAQNFFYRQVGAPTEKIRWWNGKYSRRSKRKAAQHRRTGT